MNFTTYSYRFAEEVLNSKLSTKKEIEDIISSINIPNDQVSRPRLNAEFKKEFLKRGWQGEVRLFEEPKEPMAKIDFLKERVGVEVSFSHASFIGIDLLKFQTLSYSNPDLDKIDVGVYIVATSAFHKDKLKGSIKFEKVCKYLPHFRNSVQVPIWVIGLK